MTKAAKEKSITKLTEFSYKSKYINGDGSSTGEQSRSKSVPLNELQALDSQRLTISESGEFKLVILRTMKSAVTSSNEFWLTNGTNIGKIMCVKDNVFTYQITQSTPGATYTTSWVSEP